MATIVPFRALRPRPALARRIAAVPYDVVSTDEARALAAGDPLSFLRVSRAELELPAGTDPYAPAVYERASTNFAALVRGALVRDERPGLYLYRLRAGAHTQTGIAACYLVDEYERNVIRRHERTRPDKEDDRTRHLLALGAQTGPVFMVYRRNAEVAAIVARAARSEPLVAFVADDGVEHVVWRTSDRDRDDLVRAAAAVGALYIADGHHRAASAARARAARPDRPEAAGFLGVAFPDDEVRILPYHRVVTDLGGLSRQAFLDAVSRQFAVREGSALPARKGQIAMYLGEGWYAIEPHAPRSSGPIESLDVSVLQDLLLGPVLGITDVRTDRRIDFVGGSRGTGELQRLVDEGRAAAAFSMYPVTMADLMVVSDAGGIMPPKSTWFEPKLRDGLLIHEI